MGCLGDDDGLNFADWLIVVFLILIFEGVVCAGGLAPTHGLREFASPAKLWIEGRVWESRDGATSAPRRFLCAAFAPYYVDGEETVTLPAGTLGWHFEVHLPEVSGEVWLKSEDKLGETTAFVGLVQPPSAPLNLWRHQLRHFLDPRVNGLEVLERWAHLERLTTATVAKYELPTGHRTFVFDPSGVLREKRAGGCRPDGTAVEGLLRFDDIADAPFFPRHIVHERTDTAMPGKEITRWEITHVEEIRSLEELKKLINQWDCKSAPQVSGLSASSANTSGDSLTTDAMF